MLGFEVPTSPQNCSYGICFVLLQALTDNIANDLSLKDIVAENLAQNSYGACPPDMRNWPATHYAFLDFGLSVRVPESGKLPVRPPGFQCGRPQRAPEVATILGVVPDDPFACDVYMMGRLIGSWFAPVSSILYHDFDASIANSHSRMPCLIFPASRPCST